MSLECCVLGSGSGGNCSLIRGPWGSLMIDAGFGPRATAQRLSGTGVEVSQIQALLLTHLDTDHFNPNWWQTLLKHRIRIYCGAAAARELLTSPAADHAQAALLARRADGLPATVQTLVHAVHPGDPFHPLPGIEVTAHRLDHDRAGSLAFLVRSDQYAVGWATDLGHVPDELIDAFCGVDVLALEANYDRQMQIESDRPWMLKSRIMGGAGHLSNEQAYDAVRAILDRTFERCGPDKLPRHIVLLHRSRQCNCPLLLAKLFSRDHRIGPVLTLTHQGERTPWLTARRPRAQAVRQLAMFA